MNKLSLVAAAISLFFAGAASAADLPTKAPPVVAPVFSWTGFYIGVHGGGMWADKDWTERCTAAVGAACTTFGNGGSPFRTSHQISSALGGVQGGYNWQVNNFVLGVEADWSWTGNSDTCSQIIGANGFFAINQASGCSRVDWLGTVTGRAGFTVGQALFYGKGGVAFTHDSYIARCTVAACGANPATIMTTRPSEDRVGWTVGVGIEYALGANWSVKGEYNYMDFGTERSRFQTVIFAPNDSIHDIDIRQRVSVAKVGINYRFGGPVVARY